MTDKARSRITRITAKLAGALALTLCLVAACDADDADEDTGAMCTVEGDVAGDNGCCEGLLVDFSNTCLPCVPEGEMRSVDGPGCCGDLVVADPSGTDMTCAQP